MNVPLVANILLDHSPSPSPSHRSHRQHSPNPFPIASLQKLVPRSSSTSTLGLTSPDPTDQPDSDSFKVYVRIRPLTIKEFQTTTSSIVKKQDNMVHIFDPESTGDNSRRERSYIFDNVYSERASTGDIYREALTPALQNMIQGFNSTIFAYGMTGSGKTFTMFGDIYNSLGGITMFPGLANLIVRDIFSMFSAESEKGFEFSMKLSYIEIYNEQVRDLLNPTSDNLMVLEDPAKGIIIPNLSETQINNEEQLLKLILAGNSRRVMASTYANQFSSRSHVIIQLLIEKRSKVRDIHETYTQSKLCLVDLAGSERAAVSENRGIRMTEGANINKSLLALGNCINILSDSNKRGAFVPYRNSKLTRLLKESLGGNTRTVMIACVSPSVLAFEETVNTLNYASRARRIKKKIMSNVKEVELHVSQYKEIIESLKGEISTLKTQLQERSEGNVMSKGVEGQRIESSVDELGKSLLTNLEENYEIRQNLKDLRDLKAQNESSLAEKIEKKENLAGDEVECERLGKEIMSLREVMLYNAKIEAEMQITLEENIKEKKAIEDKILNISSQLTKNTSNSTTSIDKPLREAVMSRDTLSGKTEVPKDHLDDSEEKIQKDFKIQELEKEIEVMKKEIIEKDKLLAQSKQLTRVSSFQGTAKPSKVPLYSPKGYIGQITKEPPSDIYSLRQNQSQSRDSQAKKGRSSPDKLVLGGLKQRIESSVTKKNESPRKQPGTPSAVYCSPASTFRQLDRNQSTNVIESVSVEELKNYAQILDKINFKTAKGNASSKNLSLSRAQKDNIWNGYAKQRRSVINSEVSSFGNKTRDEKSSRTSTPAKDQSKVPQLQQSEYGYTIGIEQTIEDVSTVKSTYHSTISRRKKSQSISSRQDLQQVSSPNFNLNIMFLMKEDESEKEAKSQQSKESSLQQIKVEDNSEVKMNEQGTVELAKIRNRSKFADESRKNDPDKRKSLKVATQQSSSNFNPRISEIYVQSARDSKQKKSDIYSMIINKQPPAKIIEYSSTPKPTKINILEAPSIDLSNTIEPKASNKLLSPIPLNSNDPSPVQKGQGGVDYLTFSQKSTDLLMRKTPSDIRNLESARDLVRVLRSKFSEMSNIVDNGMLDENTSREILRLVKEYSENKEFLSLKDFNTLLNLEKAANLYLKTGSNVSTPRSVLTPIREVEGKQNDPYSIYKRFTDQKAQSEAASPARAFGRDERPDLSSGLAQVDWNSLLSNQLSRSGVIYGGNTVRNSTNSIYSQARRSIRDMKDESTGEVSDLRKSADFSARRSCKGKTNIEVQNLIEKQKKHLEDFEKGKREESLDLLKKQFE